MADALKTSAEFSDLRVRLQKAVRRTAPGWLQNQVEDLVQVSLVKILRSTAGRDVNTAFLYRVAHSVIVDEIRRRRRRKEDLSATPSTPERVAGPSHISPERRAVVHQAASAVLDILKELPDDRRRAVTLYLQGHKVPEISELLGFERKKAENLVYRGLADVRAGLAERGIEP